MKEPSSCPEGFFCADTTPGPACRPTCEGRDCPEGQQCIRDRKGASGLCRRATARTVRTTLPLRRKVSGYFRLRRLGRCGCDASLSVARDFLPARRGSSATGPPAATPVSPTGPTSASQASAACATTTNNSGCAGLTCKPHRGSLSERGRVPALDEAQPFSLSARGRRGSGAHHRLRVEVLLARRTGVGGRQARAGPAPVVPRQQRLYLEVRQHTRPEFTLVSPSRFTSTCRSS